jgi:translation initiation factor 1
VSTGICTSCGLPDEICVCEDIAIEQQEIRILVDTRRYGKMMTIVEGMDPNAIDVQALMSTLKSKCACGGAYKDGHIELQGDHRQKVQKLLLALGVDARIL